MTVPPSHAEDPPPLLAGPPFAHAPAVTVLLHGRGRAPGEMVALAERIELRDMAYVALAAPGGTWYPESFLAPLATNQPHLDRALARVEEMVCALEAAGHRRRRIALVGFSQGACLACAYVFRRPTQWGALAALTGGLIGPPSTPWTTSGRLEGSPVLLATAEQDAWVPVARVRETAEVFRAMGAEVDLRVSGGADHEITAESVVATRALLARLLEP